MSGARTLLRLDRIVADLARTEAFYRDGLGFTRVAPPTRMPSSEAEVLGHLGSPPPVLRMQIGTQHVTFIEGRPGPPPRATDPSFQHLAIPVRDMGAAYRHLSALAPEPISRGGPQALPASTGGVSAYKFRDPDGLPLELIAFPGGPAAARWAGVPGLFLGIDHSALTVADLDGAIAFFTGPLGLKLAERGLNHGPEQAALDGLDQPEVDVIAIAPPQGTPHVELLHYRGLAVSDGGPGHAMTRLIFAAPDPSALAEALRQAGRSATLSADGSVCHAPGPDGHGCLVLRDEASAPPVS